MNLSSKIVIVGAGPYGLSLAAHLRARGIAFRIFGKTMLNWQTRMPRGMLLKSEGFASNLADPGDSFTLKDFCDAQGLPYGDEGQPVPREDFIAYGHAFQQRFVPELETRHVVSIRRSGGEFAVQLDDGEIVSADKIVLGIGISDFAYLPPALAGLPDEFVTHSADHEDMGAFRGRSVAVIGSGSSAIDVAALLHEGGAAVELFSRRPQLPFHTPPEHRSLRERLRAPQTGIGPGWRSVFYTQAPMLFHYLPGDLRMRIVGSHSGPAGGWCICATDRRPRRIPSRRLRTAIGRDRRRPDPAWRLAGLDGSERTIAADHVIAATGYRIDYRAVGFDEALRGELICAPAFRSCRAISKVGHRHRRPAHSFGPMFRFAFGSRFTARLLSRHLAATAVRRPIVQGAALATLMTFAKGGRTEKEPP